MNKKVIVPRGNKAACTGGCASSVHKAFAALDAAGQASLTRDLTELLERFNQAGSASLVVPSEYLEVVATRR